MDIMPVIKTVITLSLALVAIDNIKGSEDVLKWILHLLLMR